MKQVFFIIFILNSFNQAFSQGIDSVQIDYLTKIDLINSIEYTPLLDDGMISKEEYISFFYPIYLNADTLVDLIYVGPSGAESFQTQIFLNQENSLVLIKEELGKIERINKPFPDSPAEIHFIQYGCCDDPHNYYQIWTLTGNNISCGDKYHFLEKTKFPSELSHHFGIRLLNTPYMLRCTPEIINTDYSYHYEKGNIIAEYSSGDIGQVLAIEEDNTGRIWYFVAMNKPIGKGFHNYSIYRDEKWLGWISSRYVEINNYSR